LSHNENAVLDTLEKVSKSVVSINTIKRIHDIFHPVVSMGEKGQFFSLHKSRKRYFELKLIEVP
jgi:hypothetical protein